MFSTEHKKLSHQSETTQLINYIPVLFGNSNNCI